MRGPAEGEDPDDEPIDAQSSASGEDPVSNGPASNHDSEPPSTPASARQSLPRPAALPAPISPPLSPGALAPPPFFHFATFS